MLNLPSSNLKLVSFKSFLDLNIFLNKNIFLIIIILIIYMKKLLDSDWLGAVQFKRNTSAKMCNTSAKCVTPVQITIVFRLVKQQ